MLNAKEMSYSHDEIVPEFHNFTTNMVLRTCGANPSKQMELWVPFEWSQNACNIFVDKYVRKAQVPSSTMTIHEYGVPLWLQKSVPTENSMFGSETSVVQVIHRLAGCWTYWGWKYKYFDKEDEAEDFYSKIFDMLIEQKFAPNSPQWFNTGLNWAYGITGTPQGHYYTDMDGVIRSSNDSYERPQPSACFILSAKDNLIKEDGILDLAKNEARLFKFGSGTGSNFSNIRGKGEKLSSGGYSSGLMSFLKIGDVSAGSIKSGGTTRRAAKMVIVDDDHPEIQEFVNWKRIEEEKVAFLNTGSAIFRKYCEKAWLSFENLNNMPPASGIEDILSGLKQEFAENNLHPSIIDRLWETYKSGRDLDLQEIDYDWQGSAYVTVSGQNSNNSVRLSDKFMYLVTSNEEDKSWNLISRTDKSIFKTIDADKLWDDIAYNAWACADPGIHFSSTINKWHTCKTDGDIVASNPCSEYLFLNDTACNLASMNLLKYYNQEDETFDYIAFATDCDLITIVLDISVSMGQYPTKTIAERSWLYRTLGLGYANLGGLLMSMAIPYDSAKATKLAASITSLMTACAYHRSGSLAKKLGAFPRHQYNKNSMDQVIKLHHQSAMDLCSVKDLHEDNDVKMINEIADYSFSVWNSLLNFDGFRNAQVTVIAPTGTIALIMDCDTTGIEPDFSLFKYKSLAGGGSMTIVNRCIKTALDKMKVNYSEKDFELFFDAGPNAFFEAIGLTEDQQKVFDCANDISPIGHLNMMAACQPFISGAISKTVNMPEDATIYQVKELYQQAWKMGIKCIAIYRNNSKLSQPLSQVKKESIKGATPIIPDLEKVEELAKQTVWDGSPIRRKLPNSRHAYIQAVTINGHKLYIHTGEYEDGSLGEIFISMRKEGSSLGAMLNNFAVALSIGLQYGVPLEEYIEAFVGTKSEPSGLVIGHDNIKNCDSIADFIARHIAIKYLNRKEFAHVLKDEPIAVINTSEVISNKDETVLTPAKAVEGFKHKPRKINYEGESCSSCGKYTLRRNGTCFVCDSCGNTTGCS